MLGKAYKTKKRGTGSLWFVQIPKVNHVTPTLQRDGWQLRQPNSAVPAYLKLPHRMDVLALYSCICMVQMLFVVSVLSSLSPRVLEACESAGLDPALQMNTATAASVKTMAPSGAAAATFYVHQGPIWSHACANY